MLVLSLLYHRILRTGTFWFITTIFSDVSLQLLGLREWLPEQIYSVWSHTKFQSQNSCPHLKQNSVTSFYMCIWHFGPFQYFFLTLGKRKQTNADFRRNSRTVKIRKVILFTLEVWTECRESSKNSLQQEKWLLGGLFPRIIRFPFCQV